MSDAPALSRPSSVRFLLPSVRDIFFIFLFSSILVGPLSNRPLADADIGWHIRTGELILRTHAIPRADPFSVSMQGRPWFAWEWLYDVVLGLLHRAGGLNAVVWLCALIVAFTFTLLLRLLIENGTGLLLAIALTLLALGAAMIHLFARPHVVSWLLALVWFAVLDGWERTGSGQIWPRPVPGGDDPGPTRVSALHFLPISMLLWVNLHGGWIFGMALLGVFAVAASIEGLRAQNSFAAIAAGKRARGMWSAFVLSAVATLVNPYGWRLHAHIYEYLSSPYLMNRIQEFRSPDFHGWAERCFGILVLLLLFGFAVHRGKIRLSHVLVALLAVYAGFYASRSLPIASMLLVLVVGPILWEAICSIADRGGAWSFARSWSARVASFEGRMRALERELRGHLWPAVVVLGAATICLQGGWLGERHLIHAGFDEGKMPAAAATFLDHRGDIGPVFSTDAWGGYLIYRWYPAPRVLIDDRHDFYGTDYVRQYLIMMQGETAWRSILEKWQVRTALLPTGSPLANLLLELPQEWRLVYEDKVAMVFEKN